jgi:hypothetical protein
VSLITAVGQTDEVAKVEGYKTTIAALDEERKKMLSTIIGFLHCIHLRAAENKVRWLRTSK